MLWYKLPVSSKEKTPTLKAVCNSILYRFITTIVNVRVTPTWGVEGSAQFAHPDWARTTDLFYSSLDQLIRSRLLLWMNQFSRAGLFLSLNWCAPYLAWAKEKTFVFEWCNLHCTNQVDHRRRVHISMDESRGIGIASRDRVTSESDSVIEQMHNNLSIAGETGSPGSGWVHQRRDQCYESF